MTKQLLLKYFSHNKCKESPIDLSDREGSTMISFVASSTTLVKL